MSRARIGVTLCALTYLLFIQCALATAPEILYQPQSQRAVLYQPAAFGVITDSTNVTFQWLKNGEPVAGGTTDQITFPSVQFSDEGSYSVVVSDGETTTTSMEASLTVTLPRAGDVDGSFQYGSAIDSAVGALAIEPNGKLLIAGAFKTVHGAVRGGIARLNADGSTDYTFMNGLTGVDMDAEQPLQNIVTSVAVQSDGKIIVGGRFKSMNDEPCTNIARLNLDGSLDSSFTSSVSGASFPTVYSLLLQDDGKILVAGQFTTVNGVSQTNIARLNVDGSLDETFAVTTDSSSYINCLARQSDSKILIGGRDFMLDGQPHNVIARLNDDGSRDQAFQPDAISQNMSSFNASIADIKIQPDSKIVVAGTFDTVGGQTHRGIARLHSDGSLDATFTAVLPQVSNADLVWANRIRLQADGKVIVAGGSEDTWSSDPSAHFLMRYTESGAYDSSAIVDSAVNSLALRNDGELFIGGAFTSVNSRVRFRLALLTSSEQVDASFDNGASGPSGFVESMTITPDGKVLICGSQLNYVGTAARNNIARINPDGTLDSLNPDLWGKGRAVHCAGIASDGSLFVGGENLLVTPDRSERYYNYKSLVHLSASGTYVWTQSYQPVVRVMITEPNLLYGGTPGVGGWTALPTNSYMGGISMTSEGKILVSGDFNGNGIVQLLSQSSVDPSFHAAVSNQVDAFAIQPDGKILVGGGSVTLGGFVKRVARLNADGSFDATFDAGNIVRELRTIAVQSDGKIFIAGRFMLGQNDFRHIVRLNPDGTVDPTFLSAVSQTDFYSDVLHFGLQNDGKLLVAGAFRKIGSTPAAYVARLWTSDAPPVLKDVSLDADKIQVRWHALSNRVYRVQYADSIPSSDWHDLAGDIQAEGDLASKSDTATASERFYRVLQVP